MAQVLVIDDEPMIRTLVAEALGMSGHETSQASDAKEGIAKLKRRRYDLVILDIMMGESTGYDFLRAMRAMPSRADTPVIVLTAYHEPSGVLRESELGAVDHLTKPFLVDELDEAVERALGSPEGREERRQVLANDAQVYGSLIDLVQMARVDGDVVRR